MGKKHNLLKVTYYNLTESRWDKHNWLESVLTLRIFLLYLLTMRLHSDCLFIKSKNHFFFQVFLLSLVRTLKQWEFVFKKFKERFIFITKRKKYISLLYHLICQNCNVYCNLVIIKIWDYIGKRFTLPFLFSFNGCLIWA